jgi:hypothetical protein
MNGVVLMLAKVMVGCRAALACAVPASASASVLSGSETALQGLPLSGTPGVAARSVRSIATVFDSGTGTWATTFTFYGPQSATTQARLYFDLDASPLVPAEPGVGIQAWTDPANPRTTVVYSPSTTRPVATTTFSPDRRSMTITVTGLAGLPLDELDATRLSRGGVLYDGFPAMVLTPPGSQGSAPTVALPSSDRSLRVSSYPALHLRAGTILLKLGSITHPSSSAAFVELDGRIVARSTGINLGETVPAAVPLLVVPGARLPRSGRHAAKLIFVAYSPTGVSTTVTENVNLTT